MKTYTLEDLVGRWEDQRAIKNLMGKLANVLILNQEERIYPMFWSNGDDVCLGFNDGYYCGAQAVRGYYDACAERGRLVSRLLQKRFPERLGSLSGEELQGIGPFKVYPITGAIIEVAGDGKTAKGLWSCQGAHNDVEACGPVARWTWGYYCVDFRKEDSGWKIWHMQYLNDVDALCGQSWGKPEKPYPELPEFAPLKEFRYPKYTVQKCLRPYYSPDRPLTPPPACPVPYEHFEDTFSYGL